jgi:hypothetical protein
MVCAGSAKGRASPVGVPQTPAKSDVEVGRSRPITSGSDVSEDEEHDDGVNGKAPSGDIKKVKRYPYIHTCSLNHPN